MDKYSCDGEKTQGGYQEEVVFRLVESGYNVIPVSGKFPPCLTWKAYQTEKVTHDHVREWATNRFVGVRKQRYWSARLLNFGLLTGHKPYSSSPGLVVIDSDDDQSEELVRTTCPDTPGKQRTGKGGWHHVYCRPSLDEYVYIGNRQKTHQGGKRYNLDIRADGGYILAPGSIHPETGRTYQEIEPWTPDLIARCPVYDPSWIVDERHPGQPRPCRNGDGAFHHVEDYLSQINQIDISFADREIQARRYLTAVPGTRVGTGADRRCSGLTLSILYGFALLPDTALRLLLEWGDKPDQLDRDGLQYSWDEAQMLRKIEWALGQAYHGKLGDKLRRGVDIETVWMEAAVEALFSQEQEEEKERERLEEQPAMEAVAPEAEAAPKLPNDGNLVLPNQEKYRTTSDWEPPLPIETVSSAVPIFPIHVLEPILPAYHGLVKIIAEQVQVPVDLPALMGLAVLSTALGHRVHIEVRPEVYVPTILWTLCGLPSGERKTPAVTALWSPIKAWEFEQEKQNKQFVAAQKAERKLARKRMEAIEREITRVKDDDKAKDLTAKYTELELLLARPEPEVPRVLVDDATSESLVPMLLKHQGRAACLSDEAVFLEVAMGRYSHEPRLELYMRGHDGHSYICDRAGREPVHLPSVHLTLGFCIQVEPLRKYAQNMHALERGFFPRFLTAMPSSLMGRRQIVLHSPHERQQAQDEWEVLILKLLNDRTRRLLRHSKAGYQRGMRRGKRDVTTSIFKALIDHY
jgi:hypothetical protein